MTDDRNEALVSDLVERVRGQLQQELTGLVQVLRARAADERDTAAHAARAEAEAAAAALASDAIAAERSAFSERLAAACDDARSQALTAAQADERAADLARAERLLAAVRSLDAAGTLSDTLDALTSAAALEAGRAAVLVVRGDALRGWAQSGFDLDDVRAFVVPLSEAGLLGRAVSDASLVATAASDGSQTVQPPAPFTVSEAAMGVAAPIVVDGRVVAVVYADDGGGDDREVPSAWPEHLELLARHASRCLEALTARQAIRPRPRSVSAAGEGQDPEAARRYARLLVSEIKLYHGALVDEGRRAGDLRSRLADQIARARELYEQRVPPAIPSRADLFEQELVRTLADGDAALLGRAS